MNPSYCRIHTPLEEALKRFAAWNRLTCIGPLLPTGLDHAVDLACDDRGMVRGNAVLVSGVAGWSLFQDLSGVLGGIPASRWLELAGQDELLFAGYNDAISYGELVLIRRGRVIREFLDDQQSPQTNVNTGVSELPGEPFTTWFDVAGFVDSDELGFSESGSLWIW